MRAQKQWLLKRDTLQTAFLSGLDGKETGALYQWPIRICILLDPCLDHILLRTAPYRCKELESKSMDFHRKDGKLRSVALDFEASPPPTKSYRGQCWRSGQILSSRKERSSSEANGPNKTTHISHDLFLQQTISECPSESPHVPPKWTKNSPLRQ